MTREEIAAMTALDEAVERAGGYVSLPLKDNIHYDYRKLIAHCKDRGIDPIDLTIRKLDEFIIHKIEVNKARHMCEKSYIERAGAQKCVCVCQNGGLPHNARN